jgi:hypothetical protein
MAAQTIVKKAAKTIPLFMIVLLSDLLGDDGKKQA